MEYVEAVMDLTDKYTISESMDNILPRLRAGDPLPINILNKYVEVGQMELSIENYMAEETGTDLQLEIRWVEIYEAYRKQGLLRKLLEGMRKSGYPLFGSVLDPKAALIWEKIGVEFINDWDFYY